jgi:hypothetical protein
MTTQRIGVLAAASLLFGLAAVAGVGTIRYVDDDSPCPGTGTSGNPFCSIQNGVDAAAGGDIVRVRPGTYQECINARVPTAKAVAIEAENPDPATTVIDGAACFGVSTVVLSDGGRLTGLRLVGGHEGAVSSFGSVAITSNVISGNAAALSGAGIFAYSAAAVYSGPRNIDIVIEDNLVQGNTTQEDGGGIWVDARAAEGIDATALVQGNTVRNNQALGVGGGIFATTNSIVGRAATVRITANVVQGNVVSAAADRDGFGGGIWVQTYGYGYETISIDDNTVGASGGSSDPALGNRVERTDGAGEALLARGGGISATLSAFDSADHALFIENNTIRANTSSGDAGGIELFVVGDSLDLPGNPTPGRYVALVAGNAVGANTAQGFGGGILADVLTLDTTSRRNPTDVVGNVVTGNIAASGGGGIEARATAEGTSSSDVAVRHNTITGNTAHSAAFDDAFAGGLSLFTVAVGAGVARLDARFNTITGNVADVGGGGIDVASVTTPDGGNNGTTFIEIANSVVENNTGFGVGGPQFAGPGSFQLRLRSTDLSPNSEGTAEGTLEPLLVCMPASGATVGFPGIDSDADADGIDLVRLATSFASAPGAPHYNPLTDLDGDLVVDGNDLALLGARFGDTCP